MTSLLSVATTVQWNKNNFYLNDYFNIASTLWNIAKRLMVL